VCGKPSRSKGYNRKKRAKKILKKNRRRERGSLSPRRDHELEKLAVGEFYCYQHYLQRSGILRLKSSYSPKGEDGREEGGGNAQEVGQLRTGLQIRAGAAEGEIQLSVVMHPKLGKKLGWQEEGTERSSKTYCRSFDAGGSKIGGYQCLRRPGKRIWV